MPRIVGRDANDATALLLSEYSMTTADAANHHVRMKRGSLILLANRALPLELR